MPRRKSKWKNQTIMDLTLEEILFDKIERMQENTNLSHKKYHQQLTKYLIWLYKEEVVIDNKRLIYIDVEKIIGRGCTDLYLGWLNVPKNKEVRGKNVRLYKKLLYFAQDEGPVKELFPLVTEIIEITSSPKTFPSRDKYELYARYVDLFSVATPRLYNTDLKARFGIINQYTPNRIWTWDEYEFAILLPRNNFKEKKLPQTTKIMNGFDLL